MEPAATERVSATYHAFINHRGTDVKKTLASLIYHRLTGYSLRVFLDQKELHAGDKLSPAIIGAIKSASVHVAIFSEHYAESQWCLEELWWILRSKRKIIPVFYNVEPADLRHIERNNGRYRKAFEDHQLKGRYSMEDIQKWKTALNEASGISGIEFKTVESDYGVILERIVRAVLEAVEREPPEIGQKPVGLDQAVAEIDNIIKRQSELNGTTIVGIAGMPGIGKSTLATFFYYLKRPDFSRSCYLSEISKKEPCILQRQLHYELLGWDRQIENTIKGNKIFRQFLGGLKVLIVLDDVDNRKQIDSLLFTDVLGSGSLILITSRDEGLLKCSSPKIEVYKVQLLQKKHARELFCQHVFAQSEPLKGFHYLVKEVVKFCDGLPLSIRVLAGQFFQRLDEEYWKQQLEKLSRRLPEDIMGPLRLSYEGLYTDAKDIFLDVGCFLVGEDKELAVRVFEGLGYKHVCDCLEILRQRCLIDYHDDVQSDDNKIYDNTRLSKGNYGYLYQPKRDKITMHDHIKQLARDIAREAFGALPVRKPLRLSCSNDIEELMLKLQGGADSCLIRGIRTPKGQNLPDCTNYIKGVGVRLFAVEVPIDLSSLFGLWDISGDLVWLRLRSFTSICFPDTISMGNLRVLELQGHGDLDQFFQRFDEPPQNLNVLNITITDTHRASTSSSSQLFDSSYFFGFLERIGITDTHRASTSSSSQLFDRKGFMSSYFFGFLERIGTSIKFLSKIVLKNMKFLNPLPIDFGELKRLRHLDLSGCTSLTEMPNSFSELIHLQYLSFRDCSNLTIPIDILGEISTLEYVDFKGCSKLVYLPTGISNQTALRYLNLLNTSLISPINLEVPDRLERLRIGSPSLIKSVGKLRRLKELKELMLIGCRNLSLISAEEIAAPNIKLLVIAGCPIYNFIFEDQETMGNLRDFTLKNTGIFGLSIPERVLPSLETLDLSENRELMQVEGFPSTLVSLNLRGCSELSEVNDLPSRLVRLDLQGCYRLKTLTKLSNLVNLKFLSVTLCDGLETLDVEGLTSLEEIQAEACSRLKRIPGLSQLERLKCLRILINNTVIQNDICNKLTSTSHEKLSTAFLIGRPEQALEVNITSKNCNNMTSTSHEKLSTASGRPGQPRREKITLEAFYEMHKRKMASIRAKFKLKVVNAVFSSFDQKSRRILASRSETCKFETKIEDFQSYGAVLMCFLSTASYGDIFRVKFEASNDDASSDGYRIAGGGRICVFMWTEESELFRDDKGYNNIVVYSSVHYTEVWGWIMMVDKDTDVSQVCNQIMIELA